jgi:hypothetical protein
MFRELLRKVGYKFIYTYDNGLRIHDKENNVVFTSHMMANAFESREQHEEIVGLLYCIENGVRLEWIVFHLNEQLEKSIDNHKIILLNKSTLLWICGESREMYDFSKGINNKFYFEWSTDKLIAAIFAHDIKIIAT